MRRQLSFIALALVVNVDPALAASPEPPAPAPPVAPALEPPSDFAGSDACYQQSLSMSGKTANCDALIAQAQRQTPAPSWLASAHTSRGLIIARQATSEADPEALTAALSDYETAVRLDPQRLEPQINQANVLLQLGRLPEALALYDGIIAESSAAGQRYRNIALFNRAIAYRALGDLERAQADLDQARGVVHAANQDLPKQRLEEAVPTAAPLTPR